MRTLLEIFNDYEGEEILKTIIELYPEQEKNIEGYKEMITSLRDVNPNSEPQTMRIEVYNVIQKWDPKWPILDAEDYISVHGLDPEAIWDEVTGQKGEGIGWAIEYNPWADWLSWTVSCTCPDDPRTNSELKLLAHCLWEMTWAGYTQEDVKSQIDEVMEISKRIDDGTEELFELKMDDDGNFDFEDSCGCVFKDLDVEKPKDLE